MGRLFRSLASGGRNGDQNIYLWETASGRQLRSWPAHAADVWVLAFSPDDKLLVSGGESDATLKRRAKHTYSAAAWDPATGNKLYEIGRLVRVMVRETPGDKNDDDEDRRERQRNPRPPRYENRTDPERVAALAFSPDGKLLATGGFDPPHECWMVRLWDAATGKEYRLDVGRWVATAIALQGRRSRDQAQPAPGRRATRRGRRRHQGGAA
jgi:WD40 repeat protein